MLKPTLCFGYKMYPFKTEDLIFILRLWKP